MKKEKYKNSRRKTPQGGPEKGVPKYSTKMSKASTLFYSQQQQKTSMHFPNISIVLDCIKWKNGEINSKAWFINKK